MHFIPLSPQQKHADAICIGVPPQSSTRIPQREHQAVERRHALPQAKGRHRAAYQHATRRVGRSVAGVDQNPLASRHLHQARQSRPPGRRPSAGRAGKAWRNHVEAQDIFARGNGRMRPRSGRFERGHGRLSALGGKKQHPLRAPGQVDGAAQTNQCRHLEKIDVVNEIRAPLAAPVTNIEGVPPEALATQPQTARHGGSAKALSGHPCGTRREQQRHAPRSPRGTTATLAARRERESPIGLPCGARRKQQGMPPEDPAAQPQTARHSGSVEGRRGAHADGGTRHGASSRRLHRTISPWRGAGSRGATVGRPSAHCASPGRHSGPRPRQPHRPSACAASPSSKAPTA